MLGGFTLGGVTGGGTTTGAGGAATTGCAGAGAGAPGVVPGLVESAGPLRRGAAVVALASEPGLVPARGCSTTFGRTAARAGRVAAARLGRALRERLAVAAGCVARTAASMRSASTGAGVAPLPSTLSRAPACTSSTGATTERASVASAASIRMGWTEERLMVVLCAADRVVTW